jgi:hypothetical protein
MLRIITYLLSLFLALPLVAFALGIIALNHVIATRNPFKLFYHFLLAFGWGLPAFIAALLGIVVLGFFPTPRMVGASLVVIFNIAALTITLTNVGLPREAGEAVFLLPAIASAAIMIWLLTADARTSAVP